MKVAVGHEGFRANVSRFDDGGSPELSAFSSFRNRTPRLHSIDYCIGIHCATGLFIGEDALQVAECFHALEQLRVRQQETFGPIDLHERADSEPALALMRSNGQF